MAKNNYHIKNQIYSPQRDAAYLNRLADLLIIQYMARVNALATARCNRQSGIRQGQVIGSIKHTVEREIPARCGAVTFNLGMFL